MSRSVARAVPIVVAAVLLWATVPAIAQWVARDHRSPPRGSWNWALPTELPRLYREFNHAMPMAHGSRGQGMGHGMAAGMMDMGPRPPSAINVLEGRPSSGTGPAEPGKPPDEHKH